MQLVTAAFVAGFILGGLIGYWLATHIHSVAASAVSAVTRATTVPAGVVGTLNSAVPGLGTAAQSAAATVQAPAVAAVNAAAAAAPQPEPAAAVPQA
jgi:hypothetical protein